MNRRVRFFSAMAASLAGTAPAFAQSTYVQAAPPTQVAMNMPSPSLETRLEALIAANRELSAQVGELKQQVAMYRAQAAQKPTATEEGETIYVSSKTAPSSQRYENWYGLSIGDRWRLQDDTPIKLLEPNQHKLSYTVLPAGTVVTIIGAPRGVTGIYAVAVDRSTSGWASLR